MNDQDLLRQYASGGSEAAFTELVRRHLNLVHSVAMRRLNDSSAAQEVAQAVFCLLVQKAGQLSEETVLGAWLYMAACHKSREHRRAEQRRRHREQEAAAMQEPNNPGKEQDTWRATMPLLDEGMQSLGEGERQAVILRFFEQQPFGEIGKVLGLGEDGARKRVDRALDKLRVHFCRRGVTVSTGAIAAAVTTHAVQAAPAGLATVVATTTLSNAALHTAASTAAKAIAMTTLQKILIIATVVAATTTVVLQWKENRRLRRELAGLRTAADAAAQLHTGNDRVRGAGEDEKKQTDATHRELLRLRSRVTQLANELRRREGPNATNAMNTVATAAAFEA